jgi:MFS family permease
MTTTQTPTRTRTIWTFAIVSIALFMVTLDNLVVTTALPTIRVDLGASIESLEWTVNAYTLAFAVLLLTGAALGALDSSPRPRHSPRSPRQPPHSSRRARSRASARRSCCRSR